MGVGALVGAAIGWGIGGTTTAAMIGFSLGNSYDNYKEQKELMSSISSSPTYSFGPISNTKSHEIPIPIVYGENLVAGNIINQKITGENDRYMDIQVGISEGPIESITEVKANENIISPEINLGERVQDSWANNAHGQAFPYLAHYNIRLDAKALEISSTPTLTAIVKGRKIRVWDGNVFAVEYSNNPVWCVLDFITNSRYGLGISDDYIDLETFKEAAIYADELVDGEKRFQLDMVLDSRKSALDWLTEMLSIFRAFLFYSNGQLKLKIDRAEAAVQSFNMDNIISDSFAYQKTSRKERLKEVTVEYTEPDQNFERIGARFTDESMSLNSKRTITLLGVNRFSQAGRMARYYQKKSKYCTTQATWGAGIGDIQAEVGDIVLLSHDVPGWTDKPFRIIEIKEQENDELQITAFEYNEAIYSDDGVVYQASTGTSLPNPFNPPGNILNLSLIEQANVLDDGTWVPEIKVTFEKPNSIFWKYANIYLSNDNGATWQTITKTEDTNYIISGLAPDTYKVRVQSENRKRIKEDFSLAATGQITVTGKDTNPSDVTFGVCDFNKSIVLRWESISDKDLDYFEIRTDTNFGSDDAGLVARKSEISHRINEPIQRSYTFYIKAKDRSGNYSVNADSITLTNSIPSTPTQPVITSFFQALWIEISPVIDNDIEKYKVYITPSDGAGNTTGNTEIIEIATAPQKITYESEPGKYYLIEVSALDILGEGPKSAPVEAGTNYVADGDLPDEVIKARHVGANQIIANTANIADGIIDTAKIMDAAITEAKIANLSANNITTGILDADKVNIQANDGLITISENGIKSVGANGDYSLLTDEALAFYKNGSATPHWYSKNVAYGTAQDGDYVELNWDKAPKVNTAIRSLMSYNTNYSDRNQTYESYATAIDKNGFYVYGKSTIVGDNEVYNYSAEIESEYGEGYDTPWDSFISDYSVSGTNEITVSFTTDKTINYENTSLIPHAEAYVDYKKDTDSAWTTYKVYTDPPDGTKEVTIPSLSGGSYAVRIRAHSYLEGYGLFYAFSRMIIDIHQVTYTANTITADSGEVMWIAVEGGA